MKRAICLILAVLAAVSLSSCGILGNLLGNIDIGSLLSGLEEGGGGGGGGGEGQIGDLTPAKWPASVYSRYGIDEIQTNGKIVYTEFPAEQTSYMYKVYYNGVTREELVSWTNKLFEKGFRAALMVNGFLAPFLVGAAVGTFFTGSDFTVNKVAIADPSAPVISTWGNNWHGLEALAQPLAVVLGCTLVLLTAILGALYVINNVKDEELCGHMRRTIRRTAIPFVLLFVAFAVLLFTRKGYAVDADGSVSLEPFKYFHNLVKMPMVAAMLLIGVLFVVLGIVKGALTTSRKGIWYAAPGTVLVVMAVFFLAGFGGTAYYPSCTDLPSSLTIANSSSSYFTLKVMFFVSLLIPFVVAYIAYAWRQMDKKQLTSADVGY